MAKKKLSKTMVALSASAVAAVYLAGYAHTQSADAELAAADARAVTAPGPTSVAPPVQPERGRTNSASGFGPPGDRGGGGREYPIRDIDALPDQVVARQTAQGTIVNGATFSSVAFRTAVTQALAQAR